MDHRARRVLLVDDIDDMRTYLRISLERDGRCVVVGEAADGHEAIALAGSLQPDVVVLDHMMPKLTGLAALPQIREAAPSAKVLLFSAVADQLDHADGPPHGPDLAVQKGGNVRELVAAIATL